MTDMETPVQKQIKELHATFCRLTDVKLSLGIGEYNREKAWFNYLRAGLTEANLTVVVRYLQVEIGKGDRRPGALRFSNLIERLDAFEEELGLALATRRNKKALPSPRERVIRYLRPSATADAPKAISDAKHVSSFIDTLRNSVDNK